MSITNRRPGRRGLAGRHLRVIFAAVAVTLTAGAIMSSTASAADRFCTYPQYLPYKTSSTKNPCVQDLQVLLNDLYNYHHGDPTHVPNFGPDRKLTTDGIYGDNTYKDVKATNHACYADGISTHDPVPCTSAEAGSGYTWRETWSYVCGWMFDTGLWATSNAYPDAGCDDVLFRLS